LLKVVSNAIQTRPTKAVSIGSYGTNHNERYGWPTMAPTETDGNGWTKVGAHLFLGYFCFLPIGKIDSPKREVNLNPTPPPSGYAGTHAKRSIRPTAAAVPGGRKVKPGPSTWKGGGWTRVGTHPLRVTVEDCFDRYFTRFARVLATAPIFPPVTQLPDTKGRDK